MSIQNQEAQAEPVSDTTCPNCGSSGPFEAELLVAYPAWVGLIVRVGSDGIPEWEEGDPHELEGDTGLQEVFSKSSCAECGADLDLNLEASSWFIPTFIGLGGAG
jgi:hypothetical protein